MGIFGVIFCCWTPPQNKNFRTVKISSQVLEPRNGQNIQVIMICFYLLMITLIQLLEYHNKLLLFYCQCPQHSARPPDLLSTVPAPNSSTPSPNPTVSPIPTTSQLLPTTKIKSLLWIIGQHRLDTATNSRLKTSLDFLLPVTIAKMAFLIKMSRKEEDTALATTPRKA